MFTQKLVQSLEFKIVRSQALLIVRRKFIISILAFICLLLTTNYQLPTVHAQTATPSATPLPTTNYQLPTTIPPTSPQFTDLILQNTFHSFSCLAIGQSVIGQPCLTYVSGIPVLSQTNLSGGALGVTTSLIGMLYLNPPVRTADYLASVGENLGIIKTAHAQVEGSGANVLRPIESLWQVSRNISYIIMIIIFVIIGLMVMFRQRINPQTVITAQAALPGLVIGLILITFSYFLAGLISDTAFVGTNLVGYYFAVAQGKTDDPDRVNLVNKISGESVLSIFSNFVDAIERGDIENAVTSLLSSAGENVQFWFKSFAGIVAFQFGAQLGGAIPVYGPIIGFITGIAAGIGTAAFTSQVLGWVFWFIAIAILIYSMLKLLLRLISAYLTIIFLTISAPFQFLAASLPGRQGIATGWILNMLGNILIFPAVLAVFYFVAFILGKDFGPLKVTDASSINSSLIPVALAQEPIQIVGTTAFPLLGGMDLQFIKILLAFGALVALPKIPDLIVSAIGKMGQAGQLLGQEISGGIRGGQGYASQYRGGIGGAAGSIATGIGGESQYYLGEGGKVVRQTTKPGLWQLWGNTRRGGTSTGGGGRPVS